MREVEVLVKVLDLGVWEMGEAFSGLGDGDVWRRADGRLLSVGELAAHVAYWEAESAGVMAGSALVDSVARYYSVTLGSPLVLEMGAEAVYGEVKRVHESAREVFLAVEDLGEAHPSREGWDWRGILEYQAFHFGYHTGQIYSVRHLLGHQTVDN